MEVLAMLNYNDVMQEIANAKNAVQDEVRRRYLKALHEHSERDTIIYASAFTSKKLPQIPNNLISITTEDVHGFMSALHGLKSRQLDLIIHSPGGSLEAAEQIVNYLRAKYEHIRAIIPINAMSAAAMIACASDEIIMGKHSAIGPIDPQITFPTPNGHFTAPAQSILDDFTQAQKEVIANPKTAPLWINKVNAYPPGFLKMCANTIELAKEKVAEWLIQYMLKGKSGAETKAKKIAGWLGDTNFHKTHGRPINIAVADSKGLIVKPLEENQEFQEKVLSVFHATMATFEFSDCMKFVENHTGTGSFLNVKIEIKKG